MSLARKIAVAGATAAGLGLAGTGWAAERTLTISSWAPPTHGINAIFWPLLTQRIEELTDGRVTAEVRYDLGPSPAGMDLIVDGAADITWMFHGDQAERFTATRLIELPGYDGNAEAASVAYWRTYADLLEGLDEHRGVKLIALMTHGPAQLHTVEPVTALDQVRGMKLRDPGGIGSEVGSALGATGIQVPAPQVYDTLATNAADGVVMPMESRKGLNLIEVAPNVFEMPGGFYRGSFAVIMNEDRFDALPEDIRELLENELFGEPLSRLAGKVWDEIDAIARKATEETPGNAIHPASEADIETYGEISAGIRQKVLDEVSAKGVDGQAAHERIKAEMAKAAGTN